MEILSSKYLHLKKDLEVNPYVTGVDSEHYEFACELLGELLGSVVWLSKGSSTKEESRYTLSVSDELNIERLISLGYRRVERVWDEGEFAVLGDIVLIWPFSMNSLVRLSLFGNEVEKISLVDSDSRKKIKDIGTVKLLPEGTDLLVGNEISEKSIDIHLVDSFEREDAIDLGIKRISGLENTFSDRSFLEILRNYKEMGYEIIYITNKVDKYELQVGKEVRNMIGGNVMFLKSSLVRNIPRGFLSTVSKTLLLTDYEVLGEVDLSLYQKKNMDIDPGSVEILKKIIPGDYVVHKDHGIGQFVDVVQRDTGPYIEIAYAGKDKLYIPLVASENITKYIGAGRKKPVLTGLGSGIWRRISKKAKERVEDIAKELLQLYALREASETDVLIKNDGDLDELKNFVKQFEFDDTDDQILATEQIVNDFRSSKPMDRLLVGDVGYGKTEIASRAMFVAVNSGYQVAVLAPTTILVDQHVKVLRERFKNYPFNIEFLSRFSSREDRGRVLKGLEKGNIDIVVGTHALLSKEVKFKSLGLLVVDEEQKFGVKQKEEIKGRRVDSNVLSLTATPIPRTLNMALVGIRDISVLATPPSGRLEIENYFGTFDWVKIKSAIQKELKRGGQVYFLHNRVATIDYYYDKLVKMFPHFKVGIAHGQMSVQKLSKIMNDFVNGNIDILLCTTIIENGIDIPTVNTLIIDDATMLGLSQMYQIRGRIGRSSVQAYAYFFFENLKGDAVLRLEAMRDSQELGSGFLLSNKDLEIRGAGDILGKSQSGTINSVGYGLYSQMLQDAVGRLKNMGK